jgi:trk system potassium uptake protein TrkH
MGRIHFNGSLVVKLLGISLFIESAALALASLVSLYYKESDLKPLLLSTCITAAGGLLMYLTGKSSQRNSIGKREGFVFVSSVWVVFTIFGMLPFMLSGYIPNVTNAFFETMAGFTTTGSTILTDIEVLPHGLLFWRSLMQWMGGLGIILLSLAIMPLLNLGNFQLFTAESPGPTYDKLHPRLTSTARILWVLYIILTLSETLALKFAGMSLFDSACHALTTMSSGGFSTKNSSIAHWNSPLIEGIILVFMFLASCNFPMLYWLFTGKLSKIRHNEEFGLYAFTIAIIALMLASGLYAAQTYEMGHSIRIGLFHIMSFITTTGYTTTTEYVHWSPYLWSLLMIVMMIGGMAGSTAGGIKVARMHVALKHARNEMKRAIHPTAIIPIRYNGKPLGNHIVLNIMGFLIIYFVLILASALFLMSLGLHFEEAIGNVISALGDVGPGFGRYASHYAALPDAAKWLQSFLMLVGRLEIFTVLLLIYPAFWRD